jgi:hypothetical protein
MRPPDAFAHAWRLAKGRTIGLSLLLAVGLVLPAFFVGQAIDWLNSSAGILAWTGRQVLITAVAVLQTLVLLEAARIALNRPSTIPSGEYRRGLSFALALAMLIPTAFASLATSNAVIPHVSTRQQNYLFGQVLAAAWPRGHNPVLVTGDSIVDCLDPQCAAINTTALGYQVSPPSDDVTIRSDGAVYTASYLGLEVCGTRRVCTRTSTLIDPIAHAAARAIVLSPYGGTYIATAREVPSAEDPGQTASELALVFCRDVACDQPEVIRLGTVPGSVKAGQGQVLDATIGPDTRPYVTFRPSGGDAWVGWCVPVTCSDPGLARIGDVRVPAIPTFDQLVASHVDRRLLPCHGTCGERPYVPEIGRPEGGSYRVEIENSPADRLQIWVGTRPQRGQRAILLVCPESGCDGGWRIALGEDPSYLTSGEWVMAADPEGQRVVLATTSSSPWAILVVSL